MGNILLILSISFTAYLTAEMLRRVSSVTAAAMTGRVFLYELVPCAAFLLFALGVRFDFFSPARPFLLRLLGWGAAAGTVVTLAVGALIIGAGMGRDAGEADTIIVPGMALRRGRPPRGLLSRVRTAAAYAREHPDCTVLVSGGNRTDASPAEADVMRSLLLTEGIGPERIVTEDRAADTRENFLFSAEITDPAEPVIVVTGVCHMRRAVRQAYRAGFRRVLRLPAAPDLTEFGADLMWEIIAEVNYIVNGEKEPSSETAKP